MDGNQINEIKSMNMFFGGQWMQGVRIYIEHIYIDICIYIYMYIYIYTQGPRW